MRPTLPWVKMESKLVSKDCTGQLLDERIELLITRIVSGKKVPEADNKLKRKLKSRQKRGSPGMFRQAFNMIGSLPTIKETDYKSLDDISNQNECERSRVRLSDVTSMDGIGRPRRRVRFNDHVEILGEKPKSPETTPEKNISESSSPEKPDEDEEWRPRAFFFAQQYLALSKEHKELEEFTRLEKQVYAEDAVEAAMVEHNRKMEKLQRELAESEKTRRQILEQFTKLQNHSSESDKRLDEFQQQLAESANCLRALKSEKDSLVGELSKLRTTRNASEMQTSSDGIIEKETSNIFFNNAYFEDMNVLDSQCDTILTNDTQNIIYSNLIRDSFSIVDNAAINKLEDSKKSKEITNASHSELMRKIREKIGEKIARVKRDLFDAKVSLGRENVELEYITRKKNRHSDEVRNYMGELKLKIEKLKETIHLLTTENIELSKNVRKKTDEFESSQSGSSTVGRSQEKGEITSLKGEVKDLREILGETLQLKMQSEIFSHTRKCNDLEKIIASLTRKNKLLKAEIGKIRETRAREMSSEFERCRKQWRTSKRDQASQCTPEPESTPIYTSGTSSEIIDGRMKVQKLEKNAGISKSLGRNRHKRTRMILPKTILRRTLRQLVTRA